MNIAIIDDEPDSLELLKLQLRKYCPSVRQIWSFTQPVKALEQLPQLKPDLLFLDIDMPVLNGFQFLERLEYSGFALVFITAYSQYALRAFKFNALDYLVKPVDAADLIAAVHKAERSKSTVLPPLADLQRILKGEKVSRIAIPTQNGILFVLLDEIVWVEASDNYSRFCFSDGRKLIVSKTLKDVQDILEDSHFLRVHRQYLVNLNAITSFHRNEGLLVMRDGVSIPVARSHKEKLLEMFRLL